MKHLVVGFLASLFLTVSTSATAGVYHNSHRHHHFHNRQHNFHYWSHRHWHPHWGWIVPGAIIGGATVYYMDRPWTRIETIPSNTVEQQTVICSEWREILQPDGTIVKERTCNTQN